MKITAVKVYILGKDLESSMHISRGGFKTRRHAIVQVETDEGISGLGEGIGNPTLVKAIIDSQMGSRAIGLSPFDIGRLKSQLVESDVYFERNGSAICAASAIEMACWDIKGKALGTPVYQLLYGQYRSRIDTYASDVYWQKDGARMAEEAQRIHESGHDRIKVHIGAESPRSELKRLRAIRDAIGNECGLMVDLNAGYDYRKALEALDCWNEVDIFWIEEPVVPEDKESMRKLRDKSRIPIAAGENEFGLPGFKSLFDNKCIDVAMPDIGRAGGLMEARDICVLASQYGLTASPHNFSSGVLLAATLHLIASTKEASLLEVDTSGNAIDYELMDFDFTVQNGSIDVPQVVGLGVSLSDEVLGKYLVDGP